MTRVIFPLSASAPRSAPMPDGAHEAEDSRGAGLAHGKDFVRKMGALGVFLCAALAALSAPSADASGGRCAGRAGSQIAVTFDIPAGVAIEEGVRYFPDCPDPDVKLDVYYPNEKFKGGKGPYPCALAIHGGGWSMGSEKKFAMMAAFLASRGYVVACISYRLWPEYGWDCALSDGKRALAWLKKNAARFGGDPARTGVVGGSSGGVMAVQLAATSGSFWSSGIFGGADDSVQACVAMAAGCDMTNPRRFRRMFGGDRAKAARYSPYSYLTPAMPPVLLLHAERDPAVVSGESRMLKSALDALGTECEAVFYDCADHAFWNVKPDDPFRLRSWEDAANFFDRKFKGK